MAERKRKIKVPSKKQLKVWRRKYGRFGDTDLSYMTIGPAIPAALPTASGGNAQPAEK
jgi:hypothetical protein